MIKLLQNVQEIDLATGTLSTIQGGSRKLLMKANPVLALQIHAGQVYAATSTLDGAAVKVTPYLRFDFYVFFIVKKS